MLHVSHTPPVIHFADPQSPWNRRPRSRTLVLDQGPYFPAKKNRHAHPIFACKFQTPEISLSIDIVAVVWIQSGLEKEVFKVGTPWIFFGDKRFIDQVDLFWEDVASSLWSFRKPTFQGKILHDFFLSCNEPTFPLNRVRWEENLRKKGTNLWKIK